MAFGVYKQEIQHLTVTYTKNYIQRQVSWSVPFEGGGGVGVVVHTANYIYEYHRYATRSYKYVGLNLDMAKTLAQSLINKYNRIYYNSELITEGDNAGTFADNPEGHKIQGSINVNRYRGCLYEVIVNISEDDVKYDIDGKSDIDTIFSKENARGYDEE